MRSNSSDIKASDATLPRAGSTSTTSNDTLVTILTTILNERAEDSATPSVSLAGLLRHSPFTGSSTRIGLNTNRNVGGSMQELPHNHLMLPGGSPLGFALATPVAGDQTFEQSSTSDVHVTTELTVPTTPDAQRAQLLSILGEAMDIMDGDESTRRRGCYHQRNSGGSSINDKNKAKQ